MSKEEKTLLLTDVQACIDQILGRVGKRIVMGIPLGLGKPNYLVNALYRRAQSDSTISLKIITALSLDIPEPKSDLERRFAEPFIERVFGDHECLEYVADIKEGKVPDNIQVCEFFFKPGEYLGSPYAQQHYISSNYTHVARDLLAQGVNVLAQMVAVKGEGDRRHISLSCNPDVTLDLLDVLEQEEHYAGHEIITVGQVHPELPFMGNDAEVAAESFDILLESPEYNTRLFSTPNGSVGLTDHMIGLYASTLMKDAGTLQIGIGSMSDALVQACLVRHQHNDLYRKILSALDIEPRYGELIQRYGGTDTFDQGLYGSSEMFVNGFRFLIDAGIIKRKVYADLEVQRRANAGETIDPAEPGVIMHGGFFLGPADFYQWLRDMPEPLADQISMSSIGFINQLTHNPPLLRAQRQHARFVNTGLMATLSGAVVSDGLEDGRVLSGVGGQYNFVAMAHQLADARSILMVRATRGSGKKLESNIRFSYGHCTIPRHLRDIVITEYGIADLRGKEDKEVYKAMLNIADSRFQSELLQQAIKAGKLPRDYQIPEGYRHNLPHALKQKVAGLDQQTAFPAYPFGHDFTQVELELVTALGKLKSLSENKWKMMLKIMPALLKSPAEKHRAHLKRLGLDNPGNTKEKIMRGLLSFYLQE